MLLSFTSLCTIRSEAITNRIILIWIKSLSSLSQKAIYILWYQIRHFLKKWIKDDLWASKDNSIIGYWRIVNISNILSKAFRSNFTSISSIQYDKGKRINSNIPVYTKPCRKMFEKARCAKHVTQNAIRNQHFLKTIPIIFLCFLRKTTPMNHPLKSHKHNIKLFQLIMFLNRGS